MRFEVYENNAGRFTWRLVGDDGTSVAVGAARFDSRAEAGRAAAEVHRDASAAAPPDA